MGLADDAGDADFGGGNHINVDAAVGQDAEHSGGVARRILHPGTDDADRGQRVVADYGAGIEQRRTQPLDFAQGAGQVGAGYRETDVGGGAVGAGVLDDGVHADAGGGQGLKQGGGHAGAVGYALHGYFRHRRLISDAGYFDAIFHSVIVRRVVN